MHWGPGEGGERGAIGGGCKASRQSVNTALQAVFVSVPWGFHAGMQTPNANLRQTAMQSEEGAGQQGLIHHALVHPPQHCMVEVHACTAGQEHHPLGSLGPFADPTL